MLRKLRKKHLGTKEREFGGNVANLIAGGNVPGAYAGLASGPVYGTKTASAADNKHLYRYFA